MSFGHFCLWRNLHFICWCRTVFPLFLLIGHASGDPTITLGVSHLFMLPFLLIIINSDLSVSPIILRNQLLDSVILLLLLFHLGWIISFPIFASRSFCFSWSRWWRYALFSLTSKLSLFLISAFTATNFPLNTTLPKYHRLWCTVFFLPSVTHGLCLVTSPWSAAWPWAALLCVIFTRAFLVSHLDAQTCHEMLTFLHPG